MKKVFTIFIASFLLTLTGCTEVQTNESKINSDTAKKQNESINFVMSGPSMEPTLKEGYKMTIAKASDFRRGNIVVYVNPYDENLRQVHRIIGLPGETVKLENGYVLINGEKLDEPYLSEKVQGFTLPGIDKTDIYQVPDNGYFVLGDNRVETTDSRSCFRDPFNKGCDNDDARFYITKDDILGRAIDINPFELSMPSKLKVFEDLKINKDTDNIKDEEIISKIKGVMKEDEEYKLLTLYTSENYKFIAWAHYKEITINGKRYLGFVSGASLIDKSQEYPNATLTAFYPVDESNNRLTGDNYYFITEYVDENTIYILYVEKNEIQRYESKKK